MRIIDMKQLILFFSICFFLCSCATSPPAEKPPSYPKKSDSTERKTGPAMILYEQAEEDLDPYNVIVIPPDKKEDNKSAE
jgi:hypothetical protein